MKTKALVPVLILPILTPILHSQDPIATDPVGFINLTINGTSTGNGGGLSAISIPMLPQTTYSGLIASVNGNVIEDTSSTWSETDFDGRDQKNNPTHYIEVTNHPSDATQIGTMIQIIDSNASAANTLTLREDASALVGASYVIRKFRTLGEVLGSLGTIGAAEGPTNGLTSGTDFISSDLIYKVHEDIQGDGTTNGFGWMQFYYQNASSRAGGVGWRQSGDKFTNMENVIIYPDEGLLVRRRSATNLTLTMTGSVKSNASKRKILKGFNFVSTSYPVDVTLEKLGLENDLVSGSDFSSSDLLYTIDDTASFRSFYYQTAGARSGGNGWREVGDKFNDQKDVVIPAGTALIIRSRSDQSFDWSTQLTQF